MKDDQFEHLEELFEAILKSFAGIEYPFVEPTKKLKVDLLIPGTLF